MLNLNSVMIGSAKPKALAGFYEKVLGKKPDWADDEWFGWQIGNAHLTIGPHSEIKGNAKEPARIIFNFETENVEEEFERIKNIGAKVVKEPYEMSAKSESPQEGQGMLIATFADPDGNYFQLMSPWGE